MREPVEREDPTLNEGNKEVGGHEALRLLEHSESADGGRRVRRYRFRFVPLGGTSPSRGASLIRRQVEEVGSRIYILNVEVGLLPHLHRLDQLDGWKAFLFVGRRKAT